jgi:cytosine/adenosine deaminase-related metal-dependent hydrolase
MSRKYLLTGGYVATMDDTLGDFANGAVLVQDGIIKAVGKAEDFVTTDVEVINTSGGVVIPGMIDTHRHTCMSLMRGIGADQSLLQYLSNCFLRYMPATSAEDLHTASLVGALEALDSGVTTILDPCDACCSHAHAEAGLRGLKDAGIRGFFCYGMSDDEYDGAKAGKAAHDARLAHLNELHRSNSSSSNQLIQIGLSISHPGTVPFGQMATEITFAKERSMLCCSHSAPLKTSILSNGLLERADNGLMLPGHVYIHCTNLSDHEMRLIRDTGGKISIAPETEMQMGMGVPPLRACINNGLKPSLSIDTSSAVAPDLLSQMRLALQLQRCLDNEACHGDRKVPLHTELTVRDALIWGTRNGAEALGISDQIGTLTPGKRADVVFISTKRALTPSANSLGTTVLYSNGADVDTVLVDGKIVKRDGELVGHDINMIRAMAEDALHRINNKLSSLPSEMNRQALAEFLISSERSTRANFAGAYFGKDLRGDWLRKN